MVRDLAKPLWPEQAGVQVYKGMLKTVESEKCRKDFMSRNFPKMAVKLRQSLLSVKRKRVHLAGLLPGRRIRWSRRVWELWVLWSYSSFSLWWQCVYQHPPRSRRYSFKVFGRRMAYSMYSSLLVERAGSAHYRNEQTTEGYPYVGKNAKEKR